jgi:hypothetical protein
MFAETKSSSLVRAIAPRAAVFLAALAVRFAVSWNFFGCVDMWNNIDCVRFAVSGRPIVVPYLPGVQLFIWIGGLLALKTALPLTFCFKIYQFTFDAANAVLIYDIYERRNAGDNIYAGKRGALIAGLLYAFSPVAIVVSSFHAQWDPIFLFFTLFAFYLKDLPQRGWRLLSGVCFVAAIVVKPIPAMFAALMLALPTWSTPATAYAKRELAKITGAVLALAIYIVVAAHADYPVIDSLQHVSDYARHGSGGFLLGLPIESLHQNRYWLLGVVGVMSLAYFARKVDAYGAALVIFAAVIGTAGLAPQYLLWPIPFALITRRYGFLAIYGAFASAFMFLFYANPHSSALAYENMATFATLKGGATALIPSLANTGQFLPTLAKLGSYAVPLSALALVPFVIVRAAFACTPSTLSPRRRPADIHPRARWFHVAFLTVAFVFGTVVMRSARHPIPKQATIHYATQPDQPVYDPTPFGGFTPQQFETILDGKVAHYEVAMNGRRYTIPTTYEAKPRTAFSILTIGQFITVGWSLAAFIFFAIAIVRTFRLRRSFAVK